MKSNEPGDCILQGEGKNDGSCNGFDENTDLFVKQNFKSSKDTCYGWNKGLWEGTAPKGSEIAYTECGRKTCTKCKKLPCKAEYCTPKNVVKTGAALLNTIAISLDLSWSFCCY